MQSLSQAYLTAQVHTADRMDLVISLYESAIASIKQAMEAIESGEGDRRHPPLRHATDILLTLSDALNFNVESDLALSLFRIYSYHISQLLQAGRRGDLVGLQAVKSSLTILLEGWRQVAKSPEASALRKADALRFGKPRTFLPADSSSRPSSSAPHRPTLDMIA
ncbi:MAG TPA: flagellar export chaperone FliS [Candidatus Sumerlaeota bacterium]|nr:flagellar export chaperone FliS [Candidatus Sumerlaeota bacterium]HPS00114.1 flagellar export chaperone FliS [Candidatus Sumerlaeota bacterium]